MSATPATNIVTDTDTNTATNTAANTAANTATNTDTNTATNTDTNTATNTVTKTIPPVTAATFSFDNITTGIANKYEEYAFTKYKIGYPRSDSTDDKCVVKLIGIEVLAVYPPMNNADGTPPKNPKFSVVMATTDPEQVKFFESLNKTVKQLAFKNRTTWFSGGEDLTEEDVSSDMMYPKAFGALVPNETPAKYKFIVAFPFNNPEIKDPVSVHYYDPDVSQDVINSTELLEKIGRGSIIDIFMRLTNICVKTNNEYSCQATIHKRINVQKFVRGQNGPTKGLECAEVDVKKIIMGSVESNETYNSRFLSPKYAYVGSDGKARKPRNLIITFPDVKCTFRKSTKVDEKTKKVSTNYDVTYNLNPEHLAKFKEIDEYIKQDLIANYGTYEPGKRTNEKMFGPKFKGAVTDGKDKTGEVKYAPCIWASVFYKTRADGTPDFGGNFYKPNPAHTGKDDDTTPKHIKYTDNEVEIAIFGKSHKCTLTVYLKHVWFGAKYSIKYNMTNVILSTDSVDFDYGDVHVDKQSTGADLDQPDALN